MEMAGTRRFTLVAEVREWLEIESACTLQAIMEGGGRFTLCRGSEGALRGRGEGLVYCPNVWRTTSRIRGAHSLTSVSDNRSYYD